MNQQNVSQDDFDFDAVFEVDDYMYFYSQVLTDEITPDRMGLHNN